LVPGIGSGGRVDAFHELILVDELSRSGNFAHKWMSGIGLLRQVWPTLMKNNRDLYDRIMSGKYTVAVALAEKGVSGHDMSPLGSKLVKTVDGIARVTGEKNYVTRGGDADGFLVAVSAEGTESYNVVFVDNTAANGVSIGGRGSGSVVSVRFNSSMAIVMPNGSPDAVRLWLDHERWAISVHALRQSRLCFEEAYKHCQNRESGGKKLVNHQGIRWKLGEMSRQIEGAFNWLESITYQISCNNIDSASISLCKLHATRLVDYCWRETAQILGSGSICDPTSQLATIGKEITGLSVKFGSEEVLLDGSIALANERIQNIEARL
jgi:alkylation response protein AidB-like acyl-CoA dehydrogenase